MEDLQGKTAVVTGAASGIGLALSQRFAAEGMNVVMVDIETDALRAAVELLPSDKALGVVTDVSDGAQMDALGARVLDRFGAVHVVCNNAGVSGVARRSWTLTANDWQWVLGVNLWGVIHGTRVFGPMLVAQDAGHIVNTASVAGLYSAAGLAPYNASKHAVVAISETLFGELRAQGSQVGVSVLCPSFVQTSIHNSERNRPEALKNAKTDASRPEHPQAQVLRERIQSLIDGGQSPDSVADKVVSAIRERRFYILTHPETIPIVERRTRNLVDGKDPTALFRQP